jgi:hypothetical protein
MQSHRLRVLAILTVITLLSSPLVWLQADDKGDENGKDEAPAGTTALLMRAKLASTQKILEGLVTKDYQLIGKGAKELVHLSDAAAFKRSRDAVYDHFSHDFRRQAKKLGKLAERGNMDGVTFTYMRLTTSCISCHDYMRDVLKLTNVQDGEGAIRLLQTDVDK